MPKNRVVILALCLTVIVLPELAFAQALPWDSPLKTLTTSLTTTVAKAVVIFGLVASGAGLLFGGEFSDFTRMTLRLVMGGSLLLAAPSFLSLFGVTL